MERFASFLGIVGGVLLSFGFLGGLVTGSFIAPLLLAHLLLGAGLVVLWFFVVGLKHMSEAGDVVKGRQGRFGINALLYITVFISLVGLLNWYVKKHDKKFDVTENKVFSLSPQSRNIIGGLKKPLTIVGFKTLEAGEAVSDILALFRSESPSLIKTETIDPRAKPHLVEKYGMKQGNLIYLQLGDEASKSVSRINEPTEEALTNAIIKLTRGEAKKVYVVQGHDEPGVEDAKEGGIRDFVLALEDENIKAMPLNIAQQKDIPNDAAAVLLVSPKKPLLQQEKEALVRYGDAGGRLILMADPLPLGAKDTTNNTNSDMVEIADHYGITIRKDIVVDQMQRLAGAAVLGIQPFVNDYSPTGLTKGFGKDKVTLFNSASSVAIKAGGKPDEYTEILKTSPTSWGETNLELMFSQEPSAVLDKDDSAGPVALAVSFEKKLQAAKKDESSNEPQFDKLTRVVVFGDGDWISNALLKYNANRDLALNAVNWLLGEEGGVTIRARSMRASLAAIDLNTFMKILTISFIIPELILLLGLYVWWRRRQVSVA